VCSAQDNGFTIEGSNIARLDEGREVDARRAEFAYPDNTLTRRFFENRLRLDVYRGNIRVGGRLLYFRPSAADQIQFGLKDEGRIDKRYLEATLDPFKMRVGHFSDLWGSGLVFSSFENRELYFDSELDGFRGELDVGPVVVTAIRGSSEDGYLVKHAEVSGAHVSGQIGGSSVGLSYALIDSVAAYPDARTVRGIDWRLTRGIATVYGERAWNMIGFGGDAPETHATYVGLVLSKYKSSFLFDYKDYDYRRYTPFQNPPTVYREVGPRLLQGREPHTLNPADEVGYQVELSSQVRPKSFVTLHYNLTSQHDREDSFIPVPSRKQIHSPYWESFVSLDQDLPASRHVFAELGANEQAAVSWQKRKWAWAKFRTPVRGKQSIEFETEQMLVTDRTRQDRKFHDQLYGVGWEPTTSFSLALSAQFSNDDEFRRKEGRAKLLRDLGLFPNEASWLSAEAAMSFGQGAHRLIAFYGTERGGLRCSNGVCRQVQAFSGWRLTLESSL
jgi:hypothetical protein